MNKETTCLFFGAMITAGSLFILPLKVWATGCAEKVGDRCIWSNLCAAEHPSCSKVCTIDDYDGFGSCQTGGSEEECTDWDSNGADVNWYAGICDGSTCVYFPPEPTQWWGLMSAATSPCY